MSTKREIEEQFKRTMKELEEELTDKDKWAKIPLHPEEELILSTHKVKPTNEIYHLVRDGEALDSIMSQNLLKTSYNGKDYVVSFTANPSIRKLFIYPWEYEHRLVLDFPRLIRERHLVPAYYNGGISPPEEVQDYYRRLGIKDVEEYANNVTIYKWIKYNFESEWVCYHNVLDVKKYLLRTEPT